MSRIISKLNLNKTPQQVDSNSLIFAKNIKLGKDGSICRDEGIVVNFDLVTSGLLTEEESSYEWNLAGVIPDNSGYYAFYNKKGRKELIVGNVPSIIIYYDERNNTAVRLTTGWKYSGGNIRGNVTTNLKGDTILNIAEYFDVIDDKKIPLKSINLSLATNEDNQSIYTQTPKAPISNLRFLGKYVSTIPSGTYQFFIRFEIYDDYYTNWTPCSKPLFAGKKKHLDRSLVGSIDYIDMSTDSGESFYFQPEFIDIDNTINYKSFQLGFILSHEDNTVARIWKKFDMNTSIIYFEYTTQDMIEANITDFTNFSFGLYNVKNITNFKNKQYISNYVETDFNPDLSEIASDISVELCHDGEGGGSQPPAYTFALFTGSTSYYERINNIIINGSNNNRTGQIYTILSSIINAYRNKSYADGNATAKTLDTGNGISAILSEEGADGFQPTNIGDKPSGIQTFDGGYAIYFFNETCENTSLSNGLSLTENDWSSLFYINGVQKGSNKLYHYEGDEDANTEESSIYWLYFGRPVTIDGVEQWEDYMIPIIFTCYAKDTSEHVLDNNFNEYSTLVPFQEYKFYVHYVKPNGEITNGYEIGNAITETSYNTANIISAIRNKQVLYPKFSNIKIPTDYGYTACFFTIQHYKNKIFNLFNLIEKDVSDVKYDITARAFGDAIELDTELYNINNFNLITVKANNSIKYWNDTDHIGKYFSSSNTENYKTFGDEGKVLLYDGETSVAEDIVFEEGDLVFAKLKYDYDSKNVSLVKCTPYIKQETYPSTKDEAYQMDLLGYICNIRKPINYLDTNESNQRYISGGEVYKKVVYETDPTDKEVDTITLTPLTNTNFGYYYKYKESILNTIYSNFNLNYLALSDGIKPVISIKNDYLLTSIDSQLLSSVYSLPAMYKDFIRKEYYKYNPLEKTIFDNTIRSSKLLADEDKNYKLQFASGDYYNVPTTKGKITNLAAIGDIILVHTNDSMFKFSGSNSLMASGGEDIQTTETDVFDTGIAEMFGSDKGYGGLQDNRCSIITQDGYFWYDHDSNMIYAYGGNNQMNILSNAISKLMNLDKIRTVDFGNDYYNDRLIINIMFDTRGFVTLSYNTKIKNFISLHDFNTGKCFSTKTKCYFTKNEKIYTYYKLKANETEDIANKTSYGELGANDNVYPSLSNFSAGGQGNVPIIDILYKEQYELIKTVNSINWICHSIEKYTHNSDTEMAEEPKQSYAGERLRIYTDTCDTGYIDISAPRSNDEDFSHEDENHDGSALIPTNNTNYTNEYYTKPRYNLGKWYLNYFRNILNTNNKNDSDNKSLIYGKYVVARFVFDRTKNFKFENMSLNLSNNYNV